MKAFSGHNLATFLAAQWAQQIGLPVGNRWEPAVARNVQRELHALGQDDPNTQAFIIAKWRIQLGLPGQGS